MVFANKLTQCRSDYCGGVPIADRPSTEDEQHKNYIRRESMLVFGAFLKCVRHSDPLSWTLEHCESRLSASSILACLGVLG